ncbi:MAG: metal-dependent hydrolase [archaeon]
MMLKTHLVFAILVSLVFFHFFPSVNPYFFIPLVCLGSVVVDIDTSNSKVGRKVRPLSWFLEVFFGHRGFFHSLTAALLFLILSVYLFSVSFLAFAPFFGYLSHIFLDAFTLSGVPFLKPFSDRRVSGPVATGGIAEYVIFAIILSLSIYIVYIEVVKPF